MNQKIQLYSLATPNGQKVSIALEMMGIQYDAHTIDIRKGEQFSEDFLKINPNGKIPAIVDPIGDAGNPLAIMESGAILLYLAEKTGQFLPKAIGSRSRVLQWLFFQVGGVGPMFGQFGHFTVYAKDKGDLSYPIERYTNEVKRLLKVLDNQLAKTAFLAGDEISIADFATMPWVLGLDKFYKAKAILGLDEHSHITRWLAANLAFPGVEKGLGVCGMQ